MEDLLRKSALLVKDQDLSYVRSAFGRVDWSDRLVGILGARGTGKTTMLLQRLRQEHGFSAAGVYITLDDLYFSNNRLIDFAEMFRQAGGQSLYIDEVHKYPGWAQEIKNLYDTYKDLKIVFTGSSVTDILRQHADLSRRVVRYELPGLSFREYLSFGKILNQGALALKDILRDHTIISAELNGRFKPLKHLRDYLHHGFYPFFAENRQTYHIRLEQVVKMVIETDLRYIEGFDSSNIRKVYQLLYILATNVPFKPNISALSVKTGIHRNTLVQYLQHLERARLVNLLHPAGISISMLQKPDKIYLENTNLQYALAPSNVNRGTLRETFFLNQLLNAGHSAGAPAEGDFRIDEEFTVEVGGKDKSSGQLFNRKNSFVVSDDIEIGVLNKIPLWMFGFLY